MARPAKHPTDSTVFSRFAIPSIVGICMAATTFAALGQVSGMSVKHASPTVSAVSNVEFVSYSERDVMGRIKEACVITGCMIENLHPAIKAYANQMDAEQLDAARWAQIRLVDLGMQRLNTAMPGSDEAELAYYELSAAARIAYFYAQKMQPVH